MTAPAEDDDPTDLVAALLDEPFNLSPERVGRLTDRQIWELYFHPRRRKDAQGRPAPDDDGPPPDPDDLLRQFAAAGFVDPAEAERVIAERHAREAAAHAQNG